MPQEAISNPIGTGVLADLLSQTIACIDSLGMGSEVHRSQLHALRDRLTQGRFHLAVLGQVKRGKSTLLNALLREDVLPTGVVPLTAIPTFIRYDERRRGTVFFLDGRKHRDAGGGGAVDLRVFLSKFVTEEGNPNNTQGVSHVEITHPAEILKHGVVLIDTPGIGSTFRHNTEAPLNFLPQCDGALFLLSADPPITEVEVAFLKQAREKIARLFFILNKMDYLNPDDRRPALEFLRTVLDEQAGMKANAPVRCISAKQAMAACCADDPYRWERSGVMEVEQQIIEFLAREKAQVLSEAVRRKAGDVLAAAVMQLQIEVRSLQMPQEALQQRLQVFEQKIEEVKQQQKSATDLLAGDQKRMLADLEGLAAQLRADAREYLENRLREGVATSDDNELTGNQAQRLLDKIIPGYFEHQCGVTSDAICKRLTEVLRAHQERTDLLIESIRKTAATLFEVAYRAPESEKAFQMVKRPSWVTHKWTSTLSPISPGALDRILPAGARRRRILKRTGDQIDAVVGQNVENLRWTVYQSINETFRRYGSSLDKRLTETLAATHGAIRVAMDQRREHRARVADDVSRLEAARDELAGLLKRLEEA